MSNEFTKIIEKFKVRIEKRRDRQVRIKYRKFLEKFGMKNRRADKLRLISNGLKRQGIKCAITKGFTLKNQPLDEYITVRSKNESTEKISKLPVKHAGSIVYPVFRLAQRGTFRRIRAIRGRAAFEPEYGPNLVRSFRAEASSFIGCSAAHFTQKGYTQEIQRLVSLRLMQELFERRL